MTAQTHSEVTKLVEVNSVEASKIINVSLYSARAEITRRYELTLQEGQNQVTIKGLPRVLDPQSVRVEGRGEATIHDVSITPIPRKPVPTTSPELSKLLSDQARIGKSLERCEKQLAALDRFLESMNTKDTPLDQVSSIIEKYSTEAGKIQESVFELQASKAKVDQEIGEEKQKLANMGHSDQLTMQAVIGVYAETGGNVELILIYAVHQASWIAEYDIRVALASTETPVTIIYKAAISQSTGEAWDDVPLTLETAAPTYGVSLPELNPWRLSIFQPPRHDQQTFRARSGVPPEVDGRARGPTAAPQSRSPPKSRSRFLRTAADTDSESDEEEEGGTVWAAPRQFTPRGLVANSKGITATFRVPGRTTVPSDGSAHNVTIVTLQFAAEFLWVGIPKKEARVHLKAKVQNTSEYAFLPGMASVYLDGSFIAQSRIPAVSPQESFECPLGVDPSIRLTYHPLSKKVTKSGFYSKSSTHAFSQRITVHNSKSQPVSNVTILDQVPVSEDSTISVKVTSPGLTIPGTGTIASQITRTLEVAEGVTARWDGDENAFLGKDGKVKWTCSIPPLSKVTLLLEWEVIVPATATVLGL